MPLSLRCQASYVRQGGEYSITGGLPGDQVFPRLAIGPSGGYLVWQDNITDGNGVGISALRLDASLSAVLNPFRVNQTGAGMQEKPEVAMLRSGGAVMVWQGGVQGYQHIYARFLDASGVFLPGADLLVNTFTNNAQVQPTLATLTNGNVVVTWGSFNQVASASLQDVYAQVLSPSGQKVGGEFLVNQFTSYNQRAPAVAALSDGRFVVAWVSEQQRYGEGIATSSTPYIAASVDIFARLFNANGSPAGSEFLVNSLSNVCANPRIAASPDGSFMVAWSQRDMLSRPNGWEIWGRPFSSAGAPGVARQINTEVVGDQFLPSLSVSGSDYLAVWTSLGQDGSWEGIYGQYLRSDGMPMGAEFRVHTASVSRQMHPALASDGAGRFLAVWTSFIGGDNSFDLFAQRFSPVQQPLAPLPAPFVNAPFVLLNGVYQPQLRASWPPVAGLPVTNYNVYVDGAATPTTSISSNAWTLAGIAPGSTHSFQVDYDLSDGRRSPISPSASGAAWSGYNYGGLPFEWMTAYFGGDLFNWPRPVDDSDHDGVSNAQEFLAGTNPTNTLSVLRATLRKTAQGSYLDWNTQPGFIYQVQTTTNLMNSSWVTLGSPRFAAGPGDSLFLGFQPGTYYRIMLVR